MKPFKTLIFLIVVLVITLFTALIFPEEELTVGKNLKLKFHWDFNQINQPKGEYVDITEIIETNESTILEDSLELINPTDSITIDTIRAVAKELKQKVQPIEYPAGDSSIMFPFFAKLDKSSKKRVRILHYGDSQIEGDRITGYLRNKFQRKFGGSGPGLMPVIPRLAESASISHHASNNWIKYAVYYRKDTILPHRKFGILGSFARYTEYKNDSLKVDSVKNSAWIEFNESGMAYRSVRNFTEVNVFYGHCNEPFTVKGFINDSLAWFEMVDSIQETTSFKWQLEQPPAKFRIEFEGVKSPDIYGVSLDAPTGVSVDNLPFRGSSGTEFSKLDYTQLQQMTKNLNTGLLILEFGVNVVPYQVKSYKFYEKAVARQLRFLKAVMPHTPVLVIGVSDMSERKGNYYQSYPNIEKIIEAQQNAARSTGCAFWNLYKAMGGKNSMPSWVFAEPALANKDFIHFNRRGGHIVSQMLFNAIMNEYNSYKSLQTVKPMVKVES